MTKALVAAAHPTVRAGLAAVLRAGGSIEVVGEAAGTEDLLEGIAALQPDIVLLELETGNEELGAAIWQVPEAAPAVALVILCDADSRWAVEALRAGVRGVLSREALGAEIVAAVTAAGLGLVVLQQAAARALVPLEAAGAPLVAGAIQAETLTPRETEVLRLLSEGLGNKAISRKLAISEHTVKFHVGAIMAKLGAASRTEAVALAVRRGLIML